MGERFLNDPETMKETLAALKDRTNRLEAESDELQTLILSTFPIRQIILGEQAGSEGRGRRRRLAKRNTEAHGGNIVLECSMLEHAIRAASKGETTEDKPA
jgi:hypothetical protein